VLFPWLEPKENVFCDRKVRGERELLINNRDPTRLGFRRVTKVNGLIPPLDLAGIRLMHAGNDLHECAFAGAVFPQDCMNTASFDVEANIPKSLNSREMLGNPVQFENGSHWEARSDRSYRTTKSYRTRGFANNDLFHELVDVVGCNHVNTSIYDRRHFFAVG
jgi:hypothetical protein